MPGRWTVLDHRQRREEQDPQRPSQSVLLVRLLHACARSYYRRIRAWRDARTAKASACEFLCEAVVMYQRFANMDEVNRVFAAWYEF
jgi:hypothetical protein